jgi:hypothetical protein
MDEPDELDEALKECGFTIKDSVAKLTESITLEVSAGPLGTFYVCATFRNGKTLHTIFSWDDIEDTFPWKTFKVVSDETDLT